MKRIRLVRRPYPHWGRYSGYHRFVRHLKPPFVPEIREVPMGHDLFPFKNQKLRGAVLKLAKRQGLQWYELNDLVEETRAMCGAVFGGPDLIHYLDGDHSPQFIPRVARRFGGRPKVVVSFHQTPDILERIVNQRALRAFSKIVTVSSSQVDFFRKHVPASSVRVLLHGVDTDHFSPGAARKADGKFRCVTVGFWLRDFDALCATAASLESRPEFEFVIVSPSPMKRTLPKNTRLLSGIDDDALRDMYRSADALFLPLRAATANNALLEGMGCGLPAVISDLESIREYGPREAVYVAGNDPVRFAEVIVALKEDEAWRSKMAASSRARALELSWSRMAAGFQLLYEEVCG